MGMFQHFPESYMVTPGRSPSLESMSTKEGQKGEKTAAKREIVDLRKRINSLHEMLFAEKRKAVLIVLQALDAAGKDSTIRRCFGPLNPHWCETTTFREPNALEQRHDFLWRIHARVPRRGMIGIFNRSHYEDVVTAGVKQLVDPAVIFRRYEHINEFEKLLSDESIVVLKFYLNISKEYQKKRLERRLRREDKQWKFNPNDLRERKRWSEYISAYNQTFGACSTPWAPWYIIPAERRWYRDLVILRIVHSVLAGMGLSYPSPEIDLDSITVE